MHPQKLVDLFFLMVLVLSHQTFLSHSLSICSHLSLSEFRLVDNYSDALVRCDVLLTYCCVISDEVDLRKKRAIRDKVSHCYEYR